MRLVLFLWLLLLRSTLLIESVLAFRHHVNIVQVVIVLHLIDDLVGSISNPKVILAAAEFERLISLPNLFDEGIFVFVFHDGQLAPTDLLVQNRRHGGDSIGILAVRRGGEGGGGSGIRITIGCETAANRVGNINPSPEICREMNA